MKKTKTKNPNKSNFSKNCKTKPTILNKSKNPKIPKNQKTIQKIQTFQQNPKIRKFQNIQKFQNSENIKKIQNFQTNPKRIVFELSVHVFKASCVFQCFYSFQNHSI